MSSCLGGDKYNGTTQCMYLCWYEKEQRPDCEFHYSIYFLANYCFVAVFCQTLSENYASFGKRPRQFISLVLLHWLQFDPKSHILLHIYQCFCITLGIIYRMMRMFCFSQVLKILTSVLDETFV